MSVKPEKELSVIIPCHNEARLVSGCVDTVMMQLLASAGVERSEVIVVASACSDNTAQVAADALSRYDGVESRVMKVQKRGKKLALNAGLAAATGEMILCVDGDVTVTPGSIENAHKSLHEAGTRLVGGQYAPVILDSWLNKKPAPSIELLKYSKRQTTQPHKDVAGCFAGFFRQDLLTGYPKGAAPDDIWLSTYMGSRFGVDAVKISSEVTTVYLPPMTLSDMYEQMTRYRVARQLVRYEHPGLVPYLDEMQEYWKTIDGTDLRERWHQKATEHGLEFERWSARYDELVQRIDQVLACRQTLPRQDVWLPQLSTKTLSHVSSRQTLTTTV